MEARNDLPIDSLVDHFMATTKSEDPDLFAHLAGVAADARQELAGVIGRFGPSHNGELDAKGRLYVSRVLKRLRKPSQETLTLTNKVLDYVDINANATLDDDEMHLCVEILELFAGAESQNDTLSERELEILYAVLRHLDQNDNHVLDKGERAELRQLLDDPEVFMAEQWRSNPLLESYRD